MKNKYLRILVIALPGTGKTTVIKKAIDELGKEYTYVNYGDLMFEEAERKGLVKDRDKMKNLPLKIQKELQEYAAEKIRKMENEKVIIDTYVSVLTSYGYLPGLSEQVLKKINPDSIVLLEASPEEILERRKKDISRRREVGDIESIKEHLEMNRLIAMAYGVVTRAPVKIIQNHDNGLDDAVKNLKNLIEFLKKEEIKVVTP